MPVAWLARLRGDANTSGNALPDCAISESSWICPRLGGGDCRRTAHRPTSAVARTHLATQDIGVRPPAPLDTGRIATEVDRRGVRSKDQIRRPRHWKPDSYTCPRAQPSVSIVIPEGAGQLSGSAQLAPRKPKHTHVIAGARSTQTERAYHGPSVSVMRILFVAAHALFRPQASSPRFRAM